MTEVQDRPRTPEAAVRAYLDGWNAHDGAAVARVVTGTYVDPTLPAPISGDDLAAYVDGLCAAFPDLAFVAEPELVDGETVVARWRMQGTNDGAPLPGAPAPTNGTIDLPGVDVVTTKGGAVVDVVGYFDQRSMVEQLGLQAVVTPADEWPVSFGVASRVDLGKTAVPGAMSFTWIDAADSDVGEILKRSQDIVASLAMDPAFLGFRGAVIGNRLATLTFWTSPEGAEAALARNAPHNAAMERLWKEGIGAGGFTGIWQPYKVNRQFGTCPDCDRYVSISDGDATATCECGATIEVTPYF